MTFYFFFQAEDGIRDLTVTGVQTCALPISSLLARRITMCASAPPSGFALGSSYKTKFTLISIAAQLNAVFPSSTRSEEHTSELQSQSNLVCRLLLEKKKIIDHHLKFVAVTF